MKCVEGYTFCMGKANEFSNFEIKWVRKKDGGGEMEYESFIFDGVEYTLYDCVYMYKEGLSEPFIGKLMKIWEHSDMTKKVRVQWFFRQGEISKWVGDMKMMENEVFIATGNGIGLANDNPLETIAGKCNVVCISEDHRNPLPSDEELKGADYIFFRAFDVQTCTISDKMGDKVGELETKYIFNQNQSRSTITVPKIDPCIKEGNRNSRHLLKQSSCDKLQTVVGDKSDGQLTRRPVSDLSSKRKSLSGVEQNKETGRIDDFIGNRNKSQKPANINEPADRGITSKTSDKLTDKIHKKDLVDNSMRLPEDCHVGVKEDKGIARDSKKLKGLPCKKAMVDDSAKSPEEHMERNERMLTLHDANDMAVATSFVSEERPNHKNEGSPRPNEELEVWASKKLRLGSSVRISCNENKKAVQKVSTDVNGNNGKEYSKLVSSEVEQNPVMAPGSVAMEVPPREMSSVEAKKFSKGKSHMVSTPEAASDKKTLYKEFLVTPKPHVDENGFFRKLAWQERLPEEYKRGRVVMLHNLDPTYTKAEVEDIIWHGFKEHCDAEMLQMTAISSPYCGQALVIFKTTKAAERIVKELDVGNLMLSNGRPLVGTVCPPLERTNFFGHLDVKKILFLRQHQMGNMEEDVAHSFYSQPNTIEFEMALEWRLQQMRSDIWWEKLYQLQNDELQELEDKMEHKMSMDREVPAATCVTITVPFSYEVKYADVTRVMFILFPSLLCCTRWFYRGFLLSVCI